jgi:hypothetical protein
MIGLPKRLHVLRIGKLAQENEDDMDSSAITNWLGALGGAVGAFAGLAALTIGEIRGSRQRATLRAAAIDIILVRHEKSRSHWGFLEPLGGELRLVEKSVRQWRDLCEKQARPLDRRSPERQIVVQLMREAGAFLYELEKAKRKRPEGQDWITVDDPDVGDPFRKFREKTDDLCQRLETGEMS